ncbi:MAG: SDR family oxidoreductase [Chitinophagales bacterium]|nr:SDR family oxidoreductase [Chitinophagales bacterium]
METNGYSEEEWEACLKVLTILKDDPFANPDNEVFKTLITSIHKKAKKSISKTHYIQKKTEDAQLLQKTTIVANAKQVTTLYSHKPEQQRSFNNLKLATKCYICNQQYTELHFFYHRLCPECAAINYEHRTLTHDFSNYTVVLTGGRVKVGYATGLKFLRSGAKVVVTSRFPALALEQYSKEEDYQDWKDRLILYGLDLRNLHAVEDFVQFCRQNLEQVDMLVNNAAQTIKYPPEYYLPLIAKEQQLLPDADEHLFFPNTTPIATDDNLPIKWTQPLNRFGQPIDYREKNSWNSLLEEVQLEELLEVNIINHIAPYQIIAGLKPLMLRSKHKEKFIINVTSSEGQFSYANKTVFHPHTNMTKAALNMLTRTSGKAFLKENIYMTAVDVGWVSTGATEAKRVRQFDNLQIPPLDSVDSAARILHPIIEVIKGNSDLYGVLLKNYTIVDW